MLRHHGGGRQLDQRQVEVCPVVVIVRVNEDLLNAEPLLPALLHRVVMLTQHDLPVRLRLAAVEAVGGREDPLRVQERAAAGEGAAPLEVCLPGPGAGHRLEPAHDPAHSAAPAGPCRAPLPPPGGVADVVRLDVLNATLLRERETMNYGTTQKINGQIC